MPTTLCGTQRIVASIAIRNRYYTKVHHFLYAIKNDINISLFRFSEYVMVRIVVIIRPCILSEVTKYRY